MDQLKLLEKGPLATQINKFDDIQKKKKICRVFKFMSQQKGDVLFSKGDEGNAAYIILSGKIAIYSNVAGPTQKKEIAEKLAELKAREEQERNLRKAALENLLSPEHSNAVIQEQNTLEQISEVTTGHASSDSMNKKKVRQ